MNLIKRCYAFKCLFALFLPVCPALIGRVARYTPSSELNIQTKIEHRFIYINFEHLLIICIYFNTGKIVNRRVVLP